MIASTPLEYQRAHEPVPDSSTLVGFLHVLRKAHIELVGKDAAHARFNRIATREDAKQYIDEVMPRLMTERTKRRAPHRHGGGHGAGT